MNGIFKLWHVEAKTTNGVIYSACMRGIDAGDAWIRFSEKIREEYSGGFESINVHLDRFPFMGAVENE